MYRVFSCPFQGGTNQPIGDTGDSGATITPAVIISTDPPSQPPPTWARTSDSHSGSVCGREAGCEVMEMTLGIQLKRTQTPFKTYVLVCDVVCR